MLLALALLGGAASLPGHAASPAAAQTAAETPEIASAVGVSRTRVRIRFAHAVPGAAMSPGDISLTMGGESRTASTVEVAADGKTAEVDARPAWPYGTAGAIRLKGTDKPLVRVWASPGDVTPPVMSAVRLANSTICIVGASSNCASSGGTVGYTVDEAATIVLDLRRRSTDAPSLMKVSRGEGAGHVRFREKIEGRRLRPGLFRLTVYAVDAAGNESRPTTLRLRVRN
jgi:hypothetical protein